MEKHEIFFRFLVNNGLLFRFIELIHDRWHKSLKEYCDWVGDPLDFVFKFNWLETKEGGKYWGIVHREWHTFYYNEITNEKQ